MVRGVNLMVSLENDVERGERLEKTRSSETYVKVRSTVKIKSVGFGPRPPSQSFETNKFPSMSETGCLYIKSVHTLCVG
jgi:hypothetical protein